MNLFLGGSVGELDESFGRVRLWSLEGKTHSTGPDELREASKSAGDSEEDGVEGHFSHAEVGEENSRVSVHIGPGVLGLALSEEDIRSDLVEVGDELEEVIVGKMLEGEFSLALVTRISLAKNGVSVSGNDLSTLEMLPDPVLEGGLGVGVSELSHNLVQEEEHLLVGESVKRSGESGHGGREGEIGIREG